MAATLNAGKHLRSWKYDDSLDQSDVERLFDEEKVKTTKSVNCFKYWTVYCTLVGFFFLFSIGILVGFLLRADTKVQNVCKRNDGFDREKLQAVHNNIVYFMSGENIGRYTRELSALTSASSDSIDRVTAQYMEKTFRQFGFDKVEIEEHEIVVTSPDPLRPNRLEILAPDGGTIRSITFSTVAGTNKGDNLDDPGGFVEFSAEGHAKGSLVYGNFGRDEDFLQLQSSHVKMQGSVILLRVDSGSVAKKVKLALRYGCVGVLLFCHHGDPCYYGNGSGHHIPAARDFSDLDDNDLPTIPVQTVSHNVAMDLIASIPSTSLPSAWQKQVNSNTSDAAPNVYLEVNNKRSSRTVYNVIATLYGGQESDRQILLGSRRYREESDQIHLDTALNTGTLLELGKSLAYIRERELWEPRRTVKFVSFGGHRTDIGLFYYLKSYRHLLSQEAVAYIDLDTIYKGSKVMEFRSSPSLVNLLRRTADMIPDTSNPEYSLAENWPKMSHDWYLSNESAVHMYSSGEVPLLQQLGIPSISLHSLQARDNEAYKGEITHSSYHLAAARVVSLTTLKLLDDLVLPMNMSFLLQYVNHTIAHSLEALKRQISGLDYEIGSILKLSGVLSDEGSGLELASTDCSKARRLNDFLIRFEKLFQTESSGESLLYLERQSGTLSVISDVKDRYLITKNRDTVSEVCDKIHQVLKEALQEVSTVRTR